MRDSGPGRSRVSWHGEGGWVGGCDGGGGRLIFLSDSFFSTTSAEQREIFTF